MESSFFLQHATGTICIKKNYDPRVYNQQEIAKRDEQEDDKFRTLLSPDNKLTLVRHPEAEDGSSFPGYGKLTSLPPYNPNSKKYSEVDLRYSDLSLLDLRDMLSVLMHADFDTKTRWPEKLPGTFNPNRIMELGKNPGLNVRWLHQRGITGKGVGIAIIDQALLVDHVEYKDNLKMYEEIHWPKKLNFAQMHACAIASIAAGKTIGVAPGADLYQIAEQHLLGYSEKTGINADFTWLAKSIDRIVEVNKILSAGKKIRVISISNAWDIGWASQLKGYKDLWRSIEEAKKEGLFIVSSTLNETHNFNFHGLGRNSLSDPDNVLSYGPGLFWSKSFFEAGENALILGKYLMVPMDSRCTASPTGKNDYVFYSQGGLSWAIPYIAGLYALACQVKPDINPEIFWAEGVRTGDTIEIEKNNKKYRFGTIVNPIKLIESIGKIKLFS